MNVTSESIRNITLIGHSGEGKTSLAETMLYNMKTIDRIGKVDEGTSTMDYDAEEISRHLSISLAVSSGIWEETKINIIDVPGFFDFEGEKASALSACGGVVVVTSACGEVTVGTEKAIDTVIAMKVPTIIFVSQINKENANYQGTVDALREQYPRRIAVVEIPIIANDKMIGSILVLKKKAYNNKGEEMPIPVEYQELYENTYLQLAELAAESNDELLEKYFSGEPLTRKEIIAGIKDRMQHDGILLLMGGSSTVNCGVTNLLNKIVDCMPKPTDLRAKYDIEGNEVHCNSAEPVVAQVFKSIADPYVGNLSLIKVYRGILKVGDTVLNTRTGKVEKTSSLYLVNGKKQTPVDSLCAGDIGALAKLCDTKTSDTLCSSTQVVTMPIIDFPKPNIYLAIYPVEQGKEDKIAQGLSKLKEEYKTIKVLRDKETHETLIGGLGETQLAIVCKKLANKFKVEAKLVDPIIPYRETIKKKSEARGKYKKQSGGHGQYGDCLVRFEPYLDDIFCFEVAVVGGSVPKAYYPAVERGIKDSMVKGALAGYPVVNIKATLLDGSYHDVDSSEMAFKMAATAAFKEGMKLGNAVLLEPIEKVKVTVPENSMGDILGDLNKRRARILGMEAVENRQVIMAEVPRSEMFKYSTDLRSMTQGRGSFEVEFLRYEEVPTANADKIIKQYKLANGE